jgi:tRNA 2-selenouridine synthase
VAVPEGLITAMRASPCLQIELPRTSAWRCCWRTTTSLSKDIRFFCERLGALTEARGKAVVQDWQARARSGDVASVVRELLVKHYDPGYLQSMQRNFVQFAAARVLSPRDRSAEAMAVLAQSLLAENILP